MDDFWKEVKNNLHNIGLFVVVVALWAIDKKYLGLIPSLSFVGLLLVASIYGSFVFVSRIERTFLLLFYFYLCYVGIGLFEHQFILGGMDVKDAKYISFTIWTGLGFEDIKPLPSLRELVIWASVFGYVANACLIAIFIRFCTPTWLILKESN
jgi:hypothetical protein